MACVVFKISHSGGCELTKCKMLQISCILESEKNCESIVECQKSLVILQLRNHGDKLLIQTLITFGINNLSVISKIARELLENCSQMEEKVDENVGDY